jgi:ankyrin repeat protein
VELLLQRGSNANHKALQWTPLTLAASNGSIKCLKLLLEHGADISMKDGEGSFALHEAAANGKLIICCN